MALSIATDSALRGLSALEALVRSVVSASNVDETEAVEWKGPSDLIHKPGCFAIAKAILAMANRDPARAASTFEGCAYVVAGAEPGGCPGVIVDDPARYAERIQDS